MEIITAYEEHCTKIPRLVSASTLSSAFLYYSICQVKSGFHFYRFPGYDTRSLISRPGKCEGQMSQCM